jgi:hypothetical protein
MTLTQQIQAYAIEQPEGIPLTAKTFLHLGNRAAIDQALYRLAKRGQLMRVARGVYTKPIQGRFGVRAPEASKLVEGFATHLGETVAPVESASANALGLTTQVPVRQVFLTSGPNRKLNVGNQVIELRHAPEWKLGKTAMGQAIRAMFWAGEADAPAIANRILQKLSKAEFQTSGVALQKMPAWLARQVTAMTAAAHG